MHNSNSNSNDNVGVVRWFYREVFIFFASILSKIAVTKDVNSFSNTQRTLPIWGEFVVQRHSFQVLIPLLLTSNLINVWLNASSTFFSNNLPQLSQSINLPLCIKLYFLYFSSHQKLSRFLYSSIRVAYLKLHFISKDLSYIPLFEITKEYTSTIRHVGVEFYNKFSSLNGVRCNTENETFYKYDRYLPNMSSSHKKKNGPATKLPTFRWYWPFFVCLYIKIMMASWPSRCCIWYVWQLKGYSYVSRFTKLSHFQSYQ